jgi:hypothetical protein
MEEEEEEEEEEERVVRELIAYQSASLAMHNRWASR